MASPAVPGLFFCLAATVLLVFVSVSSPVWEKISFLDVIVHGQRVIHFGVLGYTGSPKTIGYTFDPSLFDFPIDPSVIHKLTFVLILHPIAAGLSAIAVLFGVCGAAYSRAGTIFMTLAAALATVVTLAAFVIDMIIWSIARDRIRNSPDPRTSAQYGNANWLTLGALVALLLAFCSGSVGACGRYRRRPEKI